MLTRRLYDAYEAAARRAPRAPALVCAGGHAVSHAELLGMVDEISRQIATARSRPTDCLVVPLGRSARHVASMLAAWRAGLAYVPVNPDDPPVRVAAIADQLAGRSLTVTADGVEPTEGAPRGLTWAPGAVAYVAFTSGSTGTPKGAVLPVPALLNRTRWSQRAYPLTSADVLLWHTPPTFDFAIWEAVACLTSGAVLLVAEQEPYYDVEAVVELGTAGGATVAHFVPSVLELVSGCGMVGAWPSLRLLYSGGEALSRRLANEVVASTAAVLVNQYGPVETCVDSTHHRVRAAPHDAPVPIGRPIDGTEFRLVDGELYLSGAGLALGYLDPGDPAGDRFTGLPGSAARWFRTGDVVEQDPGTLDLIFLGRRDDQVKVGGVLVQLGTVESMAGSIPGVTAAVAASSGSSIDLVVEAGAGLDPHAVRDHLADRLPGASAPRSITVRPNLPRLASGKLDRRSARLCMEREAADGR